MVRRRRRLSRCHATKIACRFNRDGIVDRLLQRLRVLLPQLGTEPCLKALDVVVHLVGFIHIGDGRHDRMELAREVIDALIRTLLQFVELRTRQLRRLYRTVSSVESFDEAIPIEVGTIWFVLPPVKGILCEISNGERHFDVVVRELVAIVCELLFHFAEPVVDGKSHGTGEGRRWTDLG